MTDIELFDNELYDPSTASYDELMTAGRENGFFTLPGRYVVDQLDLLGVPFVVTGVRFQAPIPDKGREGGFRDYLSLEATVADAEAIEREIKRGRVVRSAGKDAVVVSDIESLAVEPGDRIVVNDGSTGIRRQIVGLLDHPRCALINVGNKDQTRRHDLPSNRWDGIGEQTWETAEGELLPYITRSNEGKPFLLVARRGLYASQYSNEYGENTTFYLR